MTDMQPLANPNPPNEPGDARSLPTRTPDDPLAFFIAVHGPRTLSIIVWLVFAVLVTLGTRHVLIYGHFPTGATIPFMLLMLLVQGLLNTGRFKAAFAIFLWGIAGGATWSGFVVAGMQTPALLLLPLTCIHRLVARHAPGLADAGAG